MREVINLKMTVNSSTPKKRQSENYSASINSNGLLTLGGLFNFKLLLHIGTSFIHEKQFDNCI